MGQILIVEDEAAIAELISINLRHAGYEVVLASTGDDAAKQVEQVLPDLVVLDWMLPGLSGVALAKRWRAQSRTRDLPIIMLTAHASEADKITGLDAGADDYLTKPFSPSELLARIRAVLRRKAPEAMEVAVQIGPLKIDPATRRASRGDSESGEVRLGPTEFKLLYFFMAHPERVHSRSQLLDRVWGDHVFIEDRTVDVHMKRLREALAPVQCAHMLETVRGAGYRFTASAAET
jgi:two-component system, OmpR family, phosphate regulon response regulator PhoB